MKSFRIFSALIPFMFLTPFLMTSCSKHDFKGPNIERKHLQIEGTTLKGFNDAYSPTWGNCLMIPDDIASIADDAFKNEDGITQVWAPNSLKYIGESSFENCQNLEFFWGIEFGNKLYVNTVCNYAFKNCVKLEFIYLGGHVTSLGGSTFEGCENTDVYINTAVSPNMLWENSSNSWNTTNSPTIANIKTGDYQTPHYFVFDFGYLHKQNNNTYTFHWDNP